MNMRATYIFTLVCILSACSDTVPSTGDGSVDGGLTDAARDGMTLDMARDMGRTCNTGEHLCGTTCTADHANTPDVGCRLGCSDACLAPPAHAVGSCSEAGACDFVCSGDVSSTDNDNWTRDGDHCTCAPVSCTTMGAVCGTPDDGCGMPLNCGTCGASSMCMAGQCICDADGAEPNETLGTPHAIGDFNDSPGVTMDLSFNISSATDTDWFSASVSDAGFDGNPIVEVSLDGIPSGSNYDLAAYYACDSHGDSSTCDSGATDNTIGHGCVSASGGSLGEAVVINTECDGTSTDDGTLFIHVSAPAWVNTCASYALHIDVH